MKFAVLNKLLFFLFFVNLNHISYGQFIENSQRYGIDYRQMNEQLMGGGITFVDINNDGLDDMYMTGGSNQSDKMFLNIGNGKFLDFTEASNVGGITRGAETFGCISGDINNDGCEDIFVTTLGVNQANILMIGDCQGNFVNVTGTAGITERATSTSAAFLDYNNDGLLDIYVTNYIQEMGFTYDDNGVLIGYEHICFPDFLYVNQGDNKFIEMAEELGVDASGCGLAVIANDYDMDGDQDIYVINDFGEWLIPNVLFQNSSNGFLDKSIASGLDVGMYGMGVASADFDKDGDLDYYMANLGANKLMTNTNNTFSNVAVDFGVDNTFGEADKFTTGWATLWFDINNDSNLDLFVANGYIPAASLVQNTLADPDMLYEGQADGTYLDKSDFYGLNSVKIHRGAAYSDIDNDGDLDLVVTGVSKGDSESASQKTFVYRNDGVSSNNWLQIDLEGVESNRNAFGSIIKLTTSDGQVLLQQKYSGGSHASQNSEIVHFGLNQAEVSKIEVQWPSGNVSIVENTDVNVRIKILEGKNEFSVMDCEGDTGARCYVHVEEGCMDTRSEYFNPFATYQEKSCESSVLTLSDDLDSKQDLNLFPMPTSGNVKILQFDAASISVIKCYSVNGKSHELSFWNQNGNVEISAVALKAGLYIMDVNLNDGMKLTKKIIIL